MKSLLKVFSIFTPAQKRSCAILVVLMIVGAMLEAVGIGFILPLLSLMSDENFLATHKPIADMAAYCGITTHTGLVVAGAFALIAIYAVKNIYLLCQAKWQLRFSLQNQIYFSKQLLAGYLAKPYLYHLDHNTATLLRNVTSGGVVIFSNILVPTFYLITEIVTAATIWLMLAVVDFFTAAAIAGFMGAMMYAIIKMFRRRVSQLGQTQNEFSRQYVKWVNQSLGAIKETKVFRKEKYFLDEFSAAYEAYGKANEKFLFTNQTPRPIIEFLVVTGLLLIIIVKLTVMGGRPSEIVPILGVLALAAFRLMPSANRITNFYNGIKFQMPFFEELYDELIGIRDRAAGTGELFALEEKNKLSFAREIAITHLGFQYPEVKTDVLSDVNFTIPKGSFVGIVGPSGAGKTTFVDILLGLLAPDKGAITVDGTDIKNDIRAWQANLAYVPQTIYLIDGTVKENVALGIADDAIDEERLIEVLKMAELYDFVSGLPHGIDTTVGERGVKLSGGQRQRIGIARALYYQPEVLILDEATSSLDNETEKSITDTILKLKGQITIIAIAHRVSTLEQCDFKVQFSEGVAEKM